MMKVRSLLVTVAAALALPSAAHACALPDGQQPFQRATPESAGLDGSKLQKAFDYATAHNRISMRVLRHDCLVGRSALDPLTERIPNEIFSHTKGVVAMLAGIAVTDGKLDVDAPIGRYLEPGLGDAAHRAITVRQLLQETAGFKQSILAEFATLPLEANVVRQALALPFVHEPGAQFEYSQRVPDLLGHVVERAVGEDLQRYAQERLFGPIGIRDSSWFWLRDRAGNTYGYANLFMAPRDLARLGELMLHKGTWNGRRIISRAYIRQLRHPSSTNPCYGYLTWLNAGARCVSASLPSQRTVNRPLIPAAPRDTYAFVGAFQQITFVVPSLDMVVVFTGLGGDEGPDLTDLLSAAPGASLFHEVFRRIVVAVKDKRIADPGPFPADAPNLVLDPFQFADPYVLLGGLGVGPYTPAQCNLLSCPGDPTDGQLKNVAAIIKAAQGVLKP